MPTLTVSGAIDMLSAVSVKMTAERDHLCELDGHIGDADHGIAMSQGFIAVRDALREIDPTGATLSDVFNTAAKSFLNVVGASSGPLYATAFMRVGKHLKGVSEISVTKTPEVFALMATGIRDRGKAEPGDKTMMDAWAAAEAKAKNGSDVVTVLQEIAEAAQAGAQSTIDMIASKGRAARLGERSRGHIDPGAASAAMIIRVMTDAFCQIAE